MRLSNFAAHTQKRREGEPTLGEFIFLDKTRYDLSDTVTILGCTFWSNLDPTAETKIAMSINEFYIVKDWSIESYKKSDTEDIQMALRPMHFHQIQRTTQKNNSIYSPRPILPKHNLSRI